ncbi:MAG: nitroreductase family protein, partial [Candidatus Omnitrophota bacterium]
QPLRFVVVGDKNICAKIFPYLRWASYITPYGIPPAGKGPAAYIVVLAKKESKYAAYDLGAAVENILLTAWGQDIGSCWMQAIDRKSIKRILDIPKGLRLDSIIALGYCDESPVVEAFKGSVKYWKDKKGTLHVPKRSINQILDIG